MKRLILKLCLLSVLAGVYAYASVPNPCLGVSCPYCGPGIHICATCCRCNCPT